MITHRTISSRIAAFIALATLWGLIPQSARAQWVVIDPANVLQTTLIDLQQVESYGQQVQQYQTQIRQYQNMLQNTTTAPYTLIQQAASVIGNLVTAINTLTQLETQFGNLTGYLNRFGTLATYEKNSCFQRTGCAGGPLQGLQQNATLASNAQFNAVNASFQNVHTQQQQIQTDASNLQSLQSNASGATGQMQALQYGNQLASATASQLMQIRALLIAQQNMTASMYQASQNLQAQQQASSTYNHKLQAQTPPANDMTAVQWNSF